jgi:hypothetical protein
MNIFYPEKGQWYFRDDALVGSTARENAVFIIDADEFRIYYTTSESHEGMSDRKKIYSILKNRWYEEFANYHHERDCNGWDWRLEKQFEMNILW